MTLHVELDGRTFRRFALFDTLRRRRMWRRPVLFAGIMLALSLTCLMGGSLLLSLVFLAIGFGLPLAYFGTFLTQVNAQARRLDASRAVYAVTLSESGVQGPGVEGILPWTEVHAVFRVNGCAYLYVTPSRALILPGSAADLEALWSFLTQHTPGRRIP